MITQIEFIGTTVEKALNRRTNLTQESLDIVFKLLQGPEFGIPPCLGPFISLEVRLEPVL